MFGKRNKWLGFILFILVAALSLPSVLFSAEEADTETAAEYAAGVQEEYRQKLEMVVSNEPAEEEKLPLEANSYIRYMPTRRVDAMPGKIGIIESANECSYELKAFGKLPVELSFETGYISIDNSSGVKLPSHLTSLIAGIQATFPFFTLDKTYFRVGLYPSYRAENWNARTSAFRMPVHTFLIYQPDEKLTFVAGVGTYPDYETKVIPILGLIYKPNEKLIFNLIPDNPSINYTLNDKITLFVEGGIMSDEYEVDKDGLKNVILQYNAYRGGAGISYKFNKYIESSVSVGSVFNRMFKYRDSLGKVNVDSGMYSEFRLDITI
jgi:hypothetical protein